jgi:peptidoglycan hydrolase CwlO-like protein
MRNIFLSITALGVLSASLSAGDADLQQQIDTLNKKISQLEKKQKSQSKMISRVNKQSAHDNIKWDIDLRAA